MTRLAATAALLGLIATTSALAQGGASFDCAKASSAVERAICKNPQLAKADREMAAIYSTLVAKLTGQAKDHLAKDQVRWVGNRSRACTGDADAISDCLKGRYAARTETLKVLADGVYPFISEHAVYKAGKVGKITYTIDTRYPQFDGSTTDFSAVNRTFADDARKSDEDGTPKADSGVEREQTWSSEQAFALRRPSTSAVTVAIDFYGYSGGAHGFGGTTCVLVDLHTGKAVEPAGVFAPGDAWLKLMAGIVTADLKKQFVKNPGFDDALEPASLAKTLRDPSHYCWRADRLELIFNAYDVGPYAAGAYRVVVPYSRLRPLFRIDGPLAR
ncbi:MAG: DUF3298 domain-containing protein [Reyranella sp.]|uniref:DUF3298 domain-containing protein n=1 Tax=Reyranella sp. TaxID=1929291 RepID=UPI00272F53E9|nr:DUF3298 domain-containing protein [Reyranella sp.]MDP1966324.1 DUF3298 domain-containing protein [Reyranella sp.]MDP2377669.1 DUF3298 domain-containing protein [Reyranella sp.]